MAELNLKQIIDRLNTGFTGDTRKLVSWYNDNGKFAEDMKDIELENTRVYYLKPDNQFYTKYFLERVDTHANIAIKYTLAPQTRLFKPFTRSFRPDHV